MTCSPRPTPAIDDDISDIIEYFLCWKNLGIGPGSQNTRQEFMLYYDVPREVGSLTGDVLYC